LPAKSAAAGAYPEPERQASGELLAKVHKFLEAGYGSVVLLLATAVSILLANTAASAGWIGLWDGHVGPAMGAHALTLRDWVNEGLMAFFFFAVGLEIKREAIQGSLSSLTKAALPCLGALGGMLVPMAVYLGFNLLMPGGIAQGWAIPMATDIAFAMGIYGFFRDKMPPSVAAYLLTLATVDDLGAILVIALCFAGNIAFPFLGAAAAICGALYYLNKTQRAANSVWMFLVTGVCLWYCLLRGGINADVAGVLTAAAVPVAAAAPAGSTATDHHGENNPNLIDHLIYVLTPWTTLLIMPLFALANTCVPIDVSLLRDMFVKPVSLGIFAGLVIGKPLGIVLLSLLGIKMKIAAWPTNMNLKHLVIVGILGGIGFTMSLFLIGLSLQGMEMAGRLAKIAIILASSVAAIAGSYLMQGIKKEEKALPSGSYY